MIPDCVLFRKRFVHEKLIKVVFLNIEHRTFNDER